MLLSISKIPSVGMVLNHSFGISIVRHQVMLLSISKTPSVGMILNHSFGVSIRRTNIMGWYHLQLIHLMFACRGLKRRCTFNSCHNLRKAIGIYVLHKQALLNVILAPLHICSRWQNTMFSLWFLRSWFIHLDNVDMLIIGGWANLTAGPLQPQKVVST